MQQIVSFSSPKMTTRNTVTLALLMALELVISRFSFAPVKWLVISPAFMVVILIGYYYGPWLAAVAAAINDQIGYFLNPSGPDFLGFTLSAALAAFIYGVFFHQKAVQLWRVMVAVLLVVVIVNMFFDTLWLVQMGWIPLDAKIVGARVLKNVIQYPVQVALAFVILRAVLRVRPRLEKR